MGAPTSVINPKISMSLFETLLTFRRILKLVLWMRKLSAAWDAFL